MSEQPQFRNLTFERRTRNGMTVVLVSRRALDDLVWDNSMVTNLTKHLLHDHRVRSVVPKNDLTTAVPPHFHTRGVLGVRYQPNVSPREAMRLAEEALTAFCDNYQTVEVTVPDGYQTVEQGGRTRERTVRRRPSMHRPSNHVTA
ncbi:hypothetical protein HY857_01100 [Candidatus Saccharibacteria bacterium]|nr:hypothetical protein [Candidatus Saccharibacteria bacterium]